MERFDCVMTCLSFYFSQKRVIFHKRVSQGMSKGNLVDMVTKKSMRSKAMESKVEF